MFGYLTLDNQGYVSLLEDKEMSLNFEYRGRLPASYKNKRLREKQLIRRQIHRQIVELMLNPPSKLRDLYRQCEPSHKSIRGFVFQPLICTGIGVSCDLHLKIHSRDAVPTATRSCQPVTNPTPTKSPNFGFFLKTIR